MPSRPQSPTNSSSVDFPTSIAHMLTGAQALCLIWYMSSALTNTSSKSILNAYPKPVTLTIVQFAFVSFWCWVLAWLARLFKPVRAFVPALKDGLRSPTADVIKTTMPLALFQLSGHILSSSATQRIPVSLVHTIKGLSPLFTVLAYRVIFNIQYTLETYLSLIPLTLGVVMACSVEFSGNFAGIASAFVAALIFVSQNIFSKKLFNDAAKAEADALPPSQLHPKKLDKLNLLFYCSALALILTFPIWLWSEGFSLLVDVFADGKVSLSNTPSALDHGPLALEFIFNGIFHFGQNIIAFVLLSMVSPVTYSVASLIKRVFVIVAAILWFRSPTTNVQALGILLTFFGLYLYDRTHDSARAAKHVHRSENLPLLPLSTNSRHRNSTALFESPVSATARPAFNYDASYAYINGGDKKSDAPGPGIPVAGNRTEWLPPGTRQEDTWRAQDTPI